jgi:DNA-binding transcriptional ArsR family regulator
VDNKNVVKTMLDLALHPVRMRIIMLLSGSKGLTPQQMSDGMSDIPQATLYRHINRLVQGGILMVVEERPVRGTLEKVYALNAEGNQHLGPDDNGLEAFNRLSREEHLHYFTAFTMTLIDDFSRYLNHSPEGERNLAADGVGYHKLPLFLNDMEFVEFATAINQALAPFINLENTPERRKRVFATIMMPSDDSIDPSDTLLN